MEQQKLGLDVVNFVIRPLTPVASSAHAPYRVEQPCASDAVKLALRDAYTGELDLPDDFAILLRRLDEYEQR
ncbi:hypothetical protein [Sphingomonas hengshuiensis]|uniref:hypothetical protein n=1 Tax=Sphingomonas hengshuiensis TaxID=1609977 RepID=UPI00138E0C5F|nr:hypothetical protein [Sphingomonas hengshuiensis]